MVDQLVDDGSHDVRRPQGAKRLTQLVAIRFPVDTGEHRQCGTPIGLGIEAIRQATGETNAVISEP
jgi:hypothetical protein